jgi:hypothetical protein
VIAVDRVVRLIFAMAALCLGTVANANSFALDPPASLPPTAHPLSIVTATSPVILPEADAAIPLLGANGQTLGPVLSDGQFCELAAAGSGVIGDATYQVIGTAREPQANCRRYFSRLARKMPVAAGALGRSVFQKLNTAHGLGAARLRLVPWRSVLASQFPIGTVLFIPTLRERAIDGEQRHDGFVFVADRLGDAPFGRIALVVDEKQPRFAIPSGKVTGFQLDDPIMKEHLRRLHELP